MIRRRIFSSTPSDRILPILKLLLRLLVLVLLAWCILYHNAGIPRASSAPSLALLTAKTVIVSGTGMPADQKVYDVIPGQMGQTMPVFEFLDSVDMTGYMQPQQHYRNIDETHLQGLYHTGVWIHVTTSSSSLNNSRIIQLLLLKRGPHLVTCPNSWGLVGEHTIKAETPLETVQRALVEELWGGSNQSYSEGVEFIRPLTSHPVFYFRDYGPIRQGRIDRQLTYLYEVRMRPRQSDSGSTIPYLELDNEVADHQWIALDDYQQWMQRDAAAAADHVDFCHSTITRLGEFSLEKLRNKHTNDNVV